MMKCLSYINCFCNKIKLFLIKGCNEISIHIQKGVIWYITDIQILVFSKMYWKVFREMMLKLLTGICVSSYYSFFSW